MYSYLLLRHCTQAEHLHMTAILKTKTLEILELFSCTKHKPR